MVMRYVSHNIFQERFLPVSINVSYRKSHLHETTPFLGQKFLFLGGGILLFGYLG